MTIDIPTAIILFKDKLERNQSIAIEDKIGMVKPPGILNVFKSVSKRLSILSLITAIEIPKAINNDVALEMIANSLNPPAMENKKHKLA